MRIIRSENWREVTGTGAMGVIRFIPGLQVRLTGKIRKSQNKIQGLPGPSGQHYKLGKIERSRILNQKSKFFCHKMTYLIKWVEVATGGNSSRSGWPKPVNTDLINYGRSFIHRGETNDSRKILSVIHNVARMRMNLRNSRSFSGAQSAEQRWAHPLNNTSPAQRVGAGIDQGTRSPKFDRKIHYRVILCCIHF
jgi:hypothetical protein